MDILILILALISLVFQYYCMYKNMVSKDKTSKRNWSIMAIGFYILVMVCWLTTPLFS